MIPSFMQMKIANEDGAPTDEHRRFLEQLTQTLQGFVSNEGVKTPQQTTANITALNTQQSIGALLYDKETHELKVNINGTFKTVQVV